MKFGSIIVPMVIEMNEQKLSTVAQLRDGLLALYPDMSLDDYARAMAEALAAATLAGRSEILDQANGRG